MKQIWLSSLDKDEALVQDLQNKLKPYGLKTAGHFWVDDLKQAAWRSPVEKILQHDLWLIVYSEGELLKPSVRYGLSLTALAVHGIKGPSFPIVIAGRKAPPKVESLPTPFQSATVLGVSQAALPAKLTALVNRKSEEKNADYRLSLHPLPHGLCFEIFPQGSAWSGVLFGIVEGEGTLCAQAVGAPGKLPEKTVLEFPMTGVKLNRGEINYDAVAVKNKIDTQNAYYVLVQGEPSKILFGPFPDSEVAESDFYALRLK